MVSVENKHETTTGVISPLTLPSLNTGQCAMIADAFADWKQVKQVRMYNSAYITKGNTSSIDSQGDRAGP